MIDGRRSLPAWALVPLAAVAWWLLGHLPWLLQSVLAPVPGVPPGRFSPVPLTGSMVGALLAYAMTGGLLAGLLCLTAPAGRRGRATLLTFAGVVLGAAIALWRAAQVMLAWDGFAGDRLVLTGLCAVAGLASLAGWALGSCAALGRAGTGVALGALAAVVPGWLIAVFFAVAVSRSPELIYADTSWAAWAGAAVLVVALVAVGLRPPPRLAWWPLVVLVAWFIGSGLTASGYLGVYLRPGGGLPRALGEALAATWQVFGEASRPANRWLLPWVVAVVVAVALALLTPRLRRRAASPSSG